MNEMIPFGKYKGQPIEVLQNDPEYANWMAQQQWAKERYPQIVNIIINKFGDDEDTPEHNAMQAKFMDKGYCAAAALALDFFPACEIGQAYLPRSVVIESIEFGPELSKVSDLIGEAAFEANAIDVQFRFKNFFFQASGKKTKDRSKYQFPRPAIETEDWSNLYAIIGPDRQYSHDIARIELKPRVGDDYPAILRQMRNNKSNALIYGKYDGQGIDEKTFRAFMTSQGIRVASISDIEINGKERAMNKVEEANRIRSRIIEDTMRLIPVAAAMQAEDQEAEEKLAAELEKEATEEKARKEAKLQEHMKKYHGKQ